jgi:hypothetical protein
MALSGLSRAVALNGTVPGMSFAVIKDDPFGLSFAGAQT